MLTACAIFFHLIPAVSGIALFVLSGFLSGNYSFNKMMNYGSFLPHDVQVLVQGQCLHSEWLCLSYDQLELFPGTYVYSRARNVDLKCWAGRYLPRLYDSANWCTGWTVHRGWSQDGLPHGVDRRLVCPLGVTEKTNLVRIRTQWPISGISSHTFWSGGKVISLICDRPTEGGITGFTL